MTKLKRSRALKYRLHWLFLVIVWLSGFVKSASAESKFSFATTPGELPKDVIPKHYIINISPDLKNFSFKGSETIELEIQKETQRILLNSLELKISSAKLLEDTAQAATISLDDTSQIATCTFPAKVKAGRHKLELEFEGKIGSQARGLYYDKYQTDQGEKILIATQFETTYARRMFPCWDEPVFRATFQLIVEVPQKFMAVSNMPVKTERPLGGELKRVTFSRTPRMSSYLLVLVAGELEAVQGEAEDVQIRVITTHGKKEKAQYALEVMKKILPYYNDYFGIKYPLPKLDHIAIPNNFAGSAMENWGGVTYLENVLLFDPKKSSQDTKELIFNVVSHETAHQWFGDLVTMAWWDNTWLNEAFASWIANKATDHFNPDWDVWLRANGSKNWSMGSDALRTTHPIQQPVSNPSEAIEVFDEITYEKGWAFIRMLEAYLGEDAFRNGIRQYLAAHQYSNVTTADLWEALAKSSGKAVPEMASGWTEQPGFPIVKVKSSCRNGTRGLTLEQQRFILNDASPSPLEWQIPMLFTSIGSEQTISPVLLKTKSMTLLRGSCTSPLKLNAGNVGYYRVLYDPAMFDELKRVVSSGLSVADRLNLLSDTWAMAIAGHVPSTDYLNLIQALRDDTQLAIWEEILGSLGLIDQLQIGQPGRETFQAYGRSLLRPVFEPVGWDAKPGEPKSTGLLRSRLIGMLGGLKDQSIMAEARQRFQELLKNPESLAPDLRSPVLGIVGYYGDRTTYDQLHDLGRKTQSTEEKLLYYKAMAAAQDPKLAAATLLLALTDELPPASAAFTVATIATGEHAARAWEFARQNINELMAKLSSLDRQYFVPLLMSGFSDMARADELEAFSRDHLPEDARQAAAKAAEGIRVRAGFKQRELSNIDQWIRSRVQ